MTRVRHNFTCSAEIARAGCSTRGRQVRVFARVDIIHDGQQSVRIGSQRRLIKRGCLADRVQTQEVSGRFRKRLVRLRLARSGENVVADGASNRRQFVRVVAARESPSRRYQQGFFIVLGRHGFPFGQATGAFVGSGVGALYGQR